MLVNRTITRIPEELEQGVRMRQLRAGPHLHGEEEQPQQDKRADKREEANGVVRRSNRSNQETTAATNHSDTTRGEGRARIIVPLPHRLGPATDPGQDYRGAPVSIRLAVQERASLVASARGGSALHPPCRR